MGFSRLKLTLASVFFTFFIDNLSWSIAFPIFPPYFLGSGFFPELTLAKKTVMLGLFLMSFSLGQFIGAPLLGEYGDKHGRKKALLITTFFAFLAIALTAWSMDQKNLYLLFLGRTISGFFAGNMSICTAWMSELSANQGEKASHFGYLSLTAGISFVLGAFLGGKLAAFSFSFPLWLATFLSGINVLFILFGCSETREIDPGQKYHLFQSFQRIKEAIKTKRLRQMYGVYFLFLFAWMILFQCSPILVVERFSFTSSNIADLALFTGVCWAIGSGYLHKLLLTRFTSLKVLEASLFCFTCLCSSMLFLTHLYAVLAVLACCAVIGGLCWPLCTAVISDEASHENQGKVLGMSQSMQSLAMALAPAIGASAFQVLQAFPFLLAAIASFSAGILYFFLKKR